MAGVGEIEVLAFFCGSEAFGVDGGVEDCRVTVVVFFDALCRLGGIGEEEIDFLSGFVIGALERGDEEGHSETDEEVEAAEAGVFFVLVVVGPIVADGGVAVADVDLVGASFSDLFRLGGAGAENDIVVTEVEFAEGADSEHGEEFVEFSEGLREVLEVGGADVFAMKPV